MTIPGQSDTGPQPEPSERPVRGRYTLRCGTCQAVVYSSDDGPPDDRTTALVTFADTQCPRGGTSGGCPNTSDVRAETVEHRPARLLSRLREAWQQIQEGKARAVQVATEVRALDARQPRTVVVPIPALPAGRHDVPVAWPGELVNIPRVQVTLELPRAGVPAIRAAVLAGSRSATGCTIVIDTSVSIPDGQAWLHVTATP